MGIYLLRAPPHSNLCASVLQPSGTIIVEAVFSPADPKCVFEDEIHGHGGHGIDDTAEHTQGSDVAICGTLYVDIKEASNLAKDEDSYVRVDLEPRPPRGGEGYDLSAQSTRVLMNGGRKPIWDEQLSFPCFRKDMSGYDQDDMPPMLRFEVMDKDTFSGDDSLGTVAMDIDTILDGADEDLTDGDDTKEVAITALTLEKSRSNNNPNGARLDVHVKFQPTVPADALAALVGGGQGTLYVYAYKAQSLRSVERNGNDPFLKARIRAKGTSDFSLTATKVKKGEAAPAGGDWKRSHHVDGAKDMVQWDEWLAFPVGPEDAAAFKAAGGAAIQLAVFDDNTMFKHKVIGAVQVDCNTALRRPGGCTVGLAETLTGDEPAYAGQGAAGDLTFVAMFVSSPPAHRGPEVVVPAGKLVVKVVECTATRAEMVAGEKSGQDQWWSDMSPWSIRGGLQGDPLDIAAYKTAKKGKPGAPETAPQMLSLYDRAANDADGDGEIDVDGGDAGRAEVPLRHWNELMEIPWDPTAAGALGDMEMTPGGASVCFQIFENKKDKVVDKVVGVACIPLATIAQIGGSEGIFGDDSEGGKGFDRWLPVLKKDKDTERYIQDTTARMRIIAHFVPNPPAAAAEPAAPVKGKGKGKGKKGAAAAAAAAAAAKAAAVDDRGEEDTVDHQGILGAMEQMATMVASEDGGGGDGKEDAVEIEEFDGSSFFDHTASPGNLTLRILEARNLPKTRLLGTLMDPYV